MVMLINKRVAAVLTLVDDGDEERSLSLDVRHIHFGAVTDQELDRTDVAGWKQKPIIST